MTTLAPIPKRYRDDTAGHAKGWYWIADADHVSADAMLPANFLDQQLIVFRDLAGQARAADAYCPHLGAHLASHDGCIDNGEIVCPFHRWRFDTNGGACTSIPYATKIPKRAQLTSYPTMEMDGMVFMWWHPRGGEPEALPFDVMAAHADQPWIRHSVMAYETGVPVRDLSENAFDTAHIQQLHAEGAMELPQITSVVRRDHGLEVNYAPTYNKATGSTITFSQMNFSGMGMVSHVVEGEGFGFLQYSTLTPIDVERSLLRNTMYVRDTGSAEMNETVGAAFASRVRIEIEKDLAVLDYKKHLDRPQLCNGDGPIMKWRSYAEELYAG